MPVSGSELTWDMMGRGDSHPSWGHCDTNVFTWKYYMFMHIFKADL